MNPDFAPSDHFATAPDFLTVGEAIEYSRLSRSTLYSLLAAESGLRSVNLCRPGYSRGRRLIRKADLIAYLDAHAAA